VKEGKMKNTDLTRRRLLQGGLLLGTSLGLAPRFLFRPAQAATAPRRTLVSIFQRGAVDGLSMIVPHGDAAYYSLRQTTAISAPSGSGSALDLDGLFGLHPAMASLLPAWAAGELAIVHACGSPDPTRSHFDAQGYMETGLPGDQTPADGWLNRHLQTTTGNPGLRAVSVTNTTPRILSGPADVYAANTLTALNLGRGREGTIVRQAIETMYGERDDFLADTVQKTLEHYEIFTALGEQGYAPQNGAVYPDSDLGRQLREVAQVLRADIGLEVAFLSCGGWDTHAGQGGAEGNLADRLRDLADSIAAFRQDLGDEMADICLLTMSEFGRTAAQNGSGGTDHGHGTAMMALGGTVAGGVHGTWPGLAPGDLYQGRDLAITTDFRDLFAEIVREHLGNAALDIVFPGHTYSRPGVIRG
jgi:uncharacterized protein (DUF1501 family)